MIQLKGNLRLRENWVLHATSLIYTLTWLKIVLFHMSVERTTWESLVSFDLWLFLLPPLIFYALALLQEIISRAKPMRWTKIAYLVVTLPIAILNVIVAMTTQGSMGDGALIYAIPMVMVIFAAFVLPILGVIELARSS